MFLKATPKQNHNQLTPAIQKLFNRVLARVYRGNTRKKCSKERLLSLQHAQMVKKCNLPITIVTSRPSNHTLTRKRQLIPEKSSYTESFLPQNIEMKKFSSYYSQRSTDGSFMKPERCKTDSHKSRGDDHLNKHNEITANLMIHSDLIPGTCNKNPQLSLKNRHSLRPKGDDSQKNCKLHTNQSQIVRQTAHIPSRIKQMESRRKINTFIKTKNTLESDLAKERHRHLFEPWDVEQNDDFFF